jgi:hypothetical protein
MRLTPAAAVEIYENSAASDAVLAKRVRMPCCLVP